MAWWNVNGRLVSDAEQDASIPEHAVRVMEYTNPAQYGESGFAWDPANHWLGGQFQQTSPGYVVELMALRDRIRTGQASPLDIEQYHQWETQAGAIPTRDITQLAAGWQGERGNGEWTASGEWQPWTQSWWGNLDPGSPDVGPIMLQLADKLERGQASPQERALFNDVYTMAADWNWRASDPLRDGSGFGLGDNLMGALGILALGATGGLAAAPLVAGGAGLATTLGSLGTLSGIAGTGAGVLGQALDLPALSRAGTILGAVGGLAGGAGGLANLWGTGVQSLGDAARLASSAGKITGALGTASGSDALRQASRYLGMAGNLGRLGSGVLPTSFTDWSGTNAPWAANIAPQGLHWTPSSVASGGVQHLLSAADQVTERGGGSMDIFAGGSPWFDESGGYNEPIGPGLGWDAGGYPTGGYNEPIGPGLGWDSSSNPAWQQFIGYGDPYGPGSSGDLNFTGEGSGGGFLSTLGSLGSGALGLLSKSGVLGPLLSGAGGIASGALGANASREAAAAQAAALNRGLDLQTAQWLQQQANQAPWLQAGQQALPQLQQLASQGAPAPFQPPGLRFSREDYDRFLPSTTPGWTPQTYAGYTPTDTPSAAGYRYTPGQVPGAAQYRYTPGAVPTLQGAELLANDPGYQFRQDEARRALEASALARGSSMSGATLSALQRQSQDLASQEYGQAWNRASQQAQLREGWAQTASQMGWSQAEAETRLREMLAQQAGAQNWSQALQEAQQRAQQQQFGWQSGFQAQQQGQREAQGYDTDAYQRAMALNNLWYGRDIAENQTQYERALQAYNSQNAQQTTDWNRYAALAGLGQTAVGQLGSQGQAATSGLTSLLSQLGNAQAGGTLGSGQSWMSALGNVSNAAQGGLANQQLLSVLSGLNR